MTKDEINKLVTDCWVFDSHRVEYEKFANLVAAAEREACAKVCEDAPEPDGADLAERIRARGNT